MSPLKLEQPSRAIAIWAREVAHASAGVLKIMGGLLFAIVAVLIAVSTFNGLDNSGRIPHDHVTPVWIQGNWLVGEYRDCQMRTKTVPAQRTNLDSLPKLPRLFCAEDSNGVFDFQRETALIPPPPDAKIPPPGAMYLFSVTGDQLERNFHALPVRYFGRIDRTDKWVISWHCQRHSESLECKALN